MMRCAEICVWFASGFVAGAFAAIVLAVPR